MNDDPGHEAAEEITQQEQDDYISDIVDGLVLMPKNIDNNWTYCKACYIRRDHVYDSEMKVWRCDFCGVVNNALTRFRNVVIEVAETYLEENPEEE